MSDILEKSIRRLKDRSGIPGLENPDELIRTVMMETEAKRPVPVWLTVFRICSSAAAVLLIGLFIGLQEKPSAPVMTSDFKTDGLEVNTIEQHRQILSLAVTIVEFKNRAL